MLKTNRIIGLVILLLCFNSSLINANNLKKNDQNLDQNSRGELVSQTFIKTIFSEDVNMLFPEKSEHEGDVSQLPKFDIDLYSIVYYGVT